MPDEVADNVAEAIRAGIDQGLTASQIAARAGCSRSAVYWRADRAGLQVRNGHRRPRVSLREAVQDMRPAEALEFVIEAYEQLAGADDSEIELGLASGLTPGEAVVFAVLLRRCGQAVRRSALLAAMDHARGGEVASARILDVLICRIRRKLAGRWRVQTVWGYGFRMEPV